MIMDYLIVGEVVTLLGVILGIPRKMSAREACGAVVVTVLLWPIPVFMMVCAFLRAFSSR